MFETNDWVGIEVYGPEATLQRSPKELTVDVLLHVKPPDEEIIGIEVKQSADAFQKTENLEQLTAQAETETLDRLYACTPHTDQEIRLDIDPTTTQLIRQLKFGKVSKAFCGLTGKIRTRDGREWNKRAFYTQKKFKKDRDRLIKRAKREGDWQQISQNLEELDHASLFEDENWNRGDEWLHEVLKQIGVIRIDLESGGVIIPDNGEMSARLRRTRRPERVQRQNEPSESDIVHALWEHYVERSNTEVAVEVEPPSLTTVDEPNQIERFLGAQTTRSAPRPDLLVATESQYYTGIEVKAAEFDRSRLLNEQLPQYRRATELDEIVVAVPQSAVKRTQQAVEEEYPEVGLISIRDPRGDREIERIKE